jgi:hypothetical protein
LRRSDGPLGFWFGESPFTFLPEPFLGLGLQSAPPPHELGLRQRFFCPCWRCLQKGLARDIASQPVMVIPLALVRSITTPGYPAILHAAPLSLGELLPLWCVAHSSLAIWY